MRGGDEPNNEALLFQSTVDIPLLCFATVGLLDHHHHCYAMIVYGQVELCAFNRGLIPPARAVRKTSFDLHIWRPSYLWNYPPSCLPAATPVNHRMCTTTGTELTVPAPIAPASTQANITNTPGKVKVNESYIREAAFVEAVRKKHDSKVAGQSRD